MNDYKEHLISHNKTVLEALAVLDRLAEDAVLFAVDDNQRLVGSLTDGDVRRGLLKGLKIESAISQFVQQHPKFFRKSKYNIEDVIDYRSRNFKIIPVLDDSDRVINIVNFRFITSYLPVDAVIMAGGRGERLRPLTDTLPKPLLNVGSKPIIQHNVDRLMKFGVDDFWICVRYLGELIEDHYKKNPPINGSIEFVTETTALGTIGAVTLIDNFKHDHVLVMNSDLLTDIDFEDFYMDFIRNNADLSVAAIPYSVSVPYAVLETSDGKVISLKEKPMYTYYSNAGIYMIKRKLFQDIPKQSFYNATDLMEKLIAEGGKVVSYPVNGYWLDIGRKEDYAKAQEDIKKLKL